MLSKSEHDVSNSHGINRSHTHLASPSPPLLLDSDGLDWMDVMAEWGHSCFQLIISLIQNHTMFLDLIKGC